MEIFKVDVFKSTYFYSSEEPNSKRDDSTLLIGRKGFNEYRSILEIDTSSIIEACADAENIVKVELNLYLGQVLFDEQVGEYGIDVCRNIEAINLKDIKFSNYPKFKQSYAMYNIKEDFVSKFVKLDITHLKKFLFSKEGLGITILGLGAGGIVKFLKDEQKIPYLKIECNKINEIREKYLEKREGKYGFFICDDVKTIPIKNYRAIRWSKSIEEEGIFICENKYEINILEEGVYAIDYFLNIRSESEGYMFLKLDSEELDYSFVKTTFDEHGYVGHVIVRCKENSKLTLCLLGKGLLIQEFGGVGNIRVVKI